MADRLRIAVSACLLGREVRYDGRHKRDAVVVDELGPLVTFVPVCPEVEVGMGVPREPVRLVRGPGGTLMIGAESGQDWTARMKAYATRRADELAAEGVAGVVLKARSPSCGVGGVELYAADAAPTRDGVGVFARVLRERLPGLPLADDESLRDASARAGFLARAAAYARARR